MTKQNRRRDAKAAARQIGGDDRAIGRAGDGGLDVAITPFPIVERRLSRVGRVADADDLVDFANGSPEIPAIDPLHQL